ncbi:MAG: hypothetical protein U0797_23555 [Gemmataceae bacterium]
MPSIEGLRRRRKRQKGRFKTPLTVGVILLWAEDHRQRTGAWPTVRCGRVLAAPDETWFNIDQCLRKGLRNLPGGRSLPRLLVRLRGHRHLTRPPGLTEDEIAAWAEEHHARTGDWPTQHSGPVEGRPGEDWQNIDSALSAGRRGLPGGDSLPRLLERRFGARSMAAVPALTLERIAAWADDHRARTGKWPAIKSGPVALSPDDTWCAVDDALRRGNRGLPGGSSLARLLTRLRGARNHTALPSLTEEEVLAWADDHKARTGNFPTQRSGAVLAAPGEVWNGVDDALRKGRRGLPGGDSVSKLLARHGRKARHAQPAEARRKPWSEARRLARRPKPRPPRRPPAPRLTESDVLRHADEHKSRTGRWPQAHSGPVLSAAGENWRKIDNALRLGLRGLPGGDTLARLLRRSGRS